MGGGRVLGGGVRRWRESAVRRPRRSGAAPRVQLRPARRRSAREALFRACAATADQARPGESVSAHGPGPSRCRSPAVRPSGGAAVPSTPEAGWATRDGGARRREPGATAASTVPRPGGPQQERCPRGYAAVARSPARSRDGNADRPGQPAPCARYFQSPRRGRSGPGQRRPARRAPPRRPARRARRVLTAREPQPSRGSQHEPKRGQPAARPVHTPSPGFRPVGRRGAGQKPRAPGRCPPSPPPGFTDRVSCATPREGPVPQAASSPRRS